MEGKEWTLTLRIKTDAAGNIEDIEFPTALPVWGIDYMLTFLQCLERAKVNKGGKPETRLCVNSE